MPETHRPTFFYRAFQFFAYAGAIPFLINTIDILLHPSAVPINGVMGQRALTGLLIAPLTLAIGILCVRRVPDNLIGWMLIAFGYGTSALTMRLGLLPLTPTLLIANMFILLFWTAYLLLPIYFPTGRLYPPRLNRWGNPLLSVLIVLMFGVTNLFGRTITWGTGENALSAPNPFFIVEFNYTVITIPLMFSMLFFGVITLVLRYRGSTMLERLQLRWLLTGAIGQFGTTQFLAPRLAEALGIDARTITALYSLIIPLTIGIAILRYRLYDIDIIIRRTLIYSVLTGILGALYFGGIVLAQQLFKTTTGQGSDLAIVGSTLLIAALFNPLRRLIQETIDRRFYRRKYDAEQTLARFNQTLRDEVDIDTLKAQLLTVVDETMQPTHVALWVRQTPKS